MRCLFDTDHISILQRRSAPEHARLMARAARCSASDRGFSIVSLQEQSLGAHTFINRARTTADLIRDYEYLAEILQSFASAPVLPSIQRPSPSMRICGGSGFGSEQWTFESPRSRCPEA